MASHAHGIVFKIGSTAVAELRAASFGGISTTKIDSTAHDTPDKKRRFIAGLIDMGTLTLELAASAASTTAFLALVGADPAAMTVEFPDGQDFTFNGLLESFVPQGQGGVDDELLASATIQISGPFAA